MRGVLFYLILAVAISIPFSLQAKAKEEKPQLPEEVVSTEYNTRVATVLEINKAKYTLLVKGEGGTQMELKVDPEKVKNFNQIKKGDFIKIQTMKSLALTLSKAAKGEKPSDVVMTEKESAAPGAKPGMKSVEIRQITAEVMKVDIAKGTLELKGPEGNLRELKAKNPQYLTEIKKGDMITSTYTTEMAILVEPAGK